MTGLAACVAALGVGLLLAPLPRIATGPRRGIGTLLLIAAWVVLVASLIPGDDLRTAGDELASPAGAAAGLVGGLAAIALTALAARLVLAWPAIWFVALAVALPIRVPVSLGSTDGNLLVPLYAVLAVGVVAVVIGVLTGRLGTLPSPAPIVDALLAGFVAFSLVSLLWSADVEEATIKAVFFYIPFPLLYVVVLGLWPRARGLRWATAATLAIAVPIAALALYQYAIEDLFWNTTLQQANVYSRFFRVNSIFYDPNVLGRFLVIALIAAVAIAHLLRRRRDLVALAALGLVAMAALLVTFSRSSALMLMVALTMMAWRSFGGRRTGLVVAALVIAFGAAAFATSGNVRATTTSAERLETVSEGRFDLVRGGLEIWRDHPVAGAGLGSFAELYEERLDRRDRRRTRVFISHNAPVTVLSEGGIAGFALFLALGVALSVVLVRRSRGADGERWAQWVLLAIIAGIFTHTLLYSALFEDPYVWVAAAAALALGPVRAATPTGIQP